MQRLKCLLAAVVCLAGAVSVTIPAWSAGKKTTISGYVLDSACLYTMNLKKPISNQCALECAAGGSPLVILADDDMVYLPVDSKMPAQGQNYRLIKYAGKPVKITGMVYERGASKAVVIDTIQVAKAPTK